MYAAGEASVLVNGNCSPIPTNPFINYRPHSFFRDLSYISLTTEPLLNYTWYTQELGFSDANWGSLSALVILHPWEKEKNMSKNRWKLLKLVYAIYGYVEYRHKIQIDFVVKLQVCISCFITFSENVLVLYFSRPRTMKLWEMLRYPWHAVTEPEQPWQDQGGLLQLEPAAFSPCSKSLASGFRQRMDGMGWSGSKAGDTTVVPPTCLRGSVVCSLCRTNGQCS